MDHSLLRKAVYNKLNQTDKNDPIGQAIDVFLIFLISVNIVAVILETVDPIRDAYASLFFSIEVFSVLVFSVEYIARLWTCVEDPENKEFSRPRLRYILSPMALIDLVAILPFYLSFFVTFDLRFLRVLRLLRVFKLTRYSSAMSMLLDVFREEANAFFAGFFILIVLLILAASGAYLAEHTIQPEKFGSIPEAMWWAMATLTTVGYGDVTPITAVGKTFGALVTVIGVGMAALPAGILASGLADQLKRKREELSDQLRTILEDGIIDENEETELEELRKSLGLSPRIVESIKKEVLQKRAEQELKLKICPHCKASLE